MGGYDRPIAKMLKVLGFSMTLIPFYFRVLHPSTFLKEMEALRETHWRAVLLDIAAATGAGWFAIKSAQAAGTLRVRRDDCSVEEISEFSEWASDVWANDLWQAGMADVSWAFVRDANTLRLLYPKNVSSIKRLRVSRNGAPICWAIIGERRKDPKFGRMRVGSIVDCWASAENRAAVAKAASQTLEKEGFDLIVSNQSHQAWSDAFKRAGFLKGPSNFIFAASKKLTEVLPPFDESSPSFHITRADGDGLPANF
jgi:hypothetical protein